jgi:hypothetical protein
VQYYWDIMYFLGKENTQSWKSYMWLKNITTFFRTIPSPAPIYTDAVLFPLPRQYMTSPHVPSPTSSVHDIPERFGQDGHLDVLEDLANIVRVRGAGFVHEQRAFSTVWAGKNFFYKYLLLWILQEAIKKSLKPTSARIQKGQICNVADPGSGAFLTPGSVMGKNRDPDHI